jgi:hypothetical protein
MKENAVRRKGVHEKIVCLCVECSKLHSIVYKHHNHHRLNQSIS